MSLEANKELRLWDLQSGEKLVLDASYQTDLLVLISQILWVSHHSDVTGSVSGDSDLDATSEVGNLEFSRSITASSGTSDD